MNVHFNTNPRQHTTQINPQGLLNMIVPNIAAIHKKLNKRKILFACLIPVSVIMFMGGGILFGTTGSDFGPNFAMMPIMFLGFFSFPVWGILIGITSMKTASYQVLINLINEISFQDKCHLDSLTLSKMTGRSTVIMAINKLIETGNLPDYEVIGDVGVAKTSLRARVSDFPAAAASAFHPAATPTEVAPSRTHCPGCRAPITRQTDRFCPFCGVKMD
jgi:predicted XRE-type DNA-binding protein